MPNVIHIVAHCTVKMIDSKTDYLVLMCVRLCDQWTFSFANLFLDRINNDCLLSSNHIIFFIESMICRFNSIFIKWLNIEKRTNKFSLIENTYITKQCTWIVNKGSILMYNALIHKINCWASIIKTHRYSCPFLYLT